MADPVTPARPVQLERLMALIATLRGENGCPWDKQQTPHSMARYLLEEVGELVDAIVSGDAEAVCEEAGDVLFQLLFVVHLYREAGRFDLFDVIERNLEKMIRRHPHVFGEAIAATAAKVSENWAKIKLTEKGAAQPSVLDAVPQSLPALTRALLISERAANTGFDWDDLAGVMAKTMEEWSEFSREITRRSGENDTDKAAMEFGDILFTLVNVARFTRIHPEMALIRATQKFVHRFNYMEAKAIQAGETIDQIPVARMHLLWDEAKASVG